LSSEEYYSISPRPYFPSADVMVIELPRALVCRPAASWKPLQLKMNPSEMKWRKMFPACRFILLLKMKCQSFIRWAIFSAENIKSADPSGPAV